MKRRHWSSEPGYPQKVWTEADWRDWEKAGRPAIPRENRLPLAQHPPLDTLPVIVPPVTLGGFSLYPRKSSARDARGRAVDKLISKHVGR